MVKRGVVLFIALAVVSGAWLLQCSGPKPESQNVTVREPAQPGLPYQVEVQVRNAWRGHGEVQVEAELSDRDSDRRYEGRRNVAVRPMETVNVVVPVQAEPGNYEPRVEVVYPPR